MFKRTFLCVVTVLLAYWIAGCGIRPQMDFYVNPMATAEEQKVDEKARSITYEDDDVFIKVTAVDILDLMKVTSEPHVNPYIYVSDWGKARARYTVFDVTVKNKMDSDLPFNPAGIILMDDQGEQYEAFTLEELREKYGFPYTAEREVIYYPPRLYRPSWHYRYRYWPHPWYYNYDLYWGYRPGYVREVYDIGYLRRAILKGTMLSKVDLYTGGKRDGFLVFPLVEPEATELKIILPAFVTEQGKKLEFHFKRIPAVKD